MTGVIVLLVALAATGVVALLLRRRDGRFSTPVPAASASSVAVDGAQEPDPGASSAMAAESREVLTAEEIGGPLGDRLTFVQFSSAFCSPCRATRALLSDVVATRPDVVHVEVDAESHLHLVRRLNILRTPTVLVVGPDGTVLSRASGLPRRDQVLAVLDA
ncbi:thiol-disulfide isomerase/thioredoxin [Aeromicrobium sp. SORGH_AS981]|uniref:thioredoxin family protein n=1 Tax=Aeromicrobium sp. SORGH_AS_0981 TaxID=3041802 RepID=UPI00285C3255|nr:thioredoxin family protein [Aeromicrobium sp. SORGH_AS_0981]MDR6117210.1 thiol-disulfide isomerase/thioredoxin [Aeromicrobium sp. SORGH_AS_0981]